MRLIPLLAFLAVPLLAPAQDKKPLPPEQAKAALLKLLDRPKVPADVKLERPPQDKNGLAYTRWSFASEKKADGTTERVPVLTVAPADAKGRLPAMIVLHGTGGSKDAVASWLEEFARNGIVGIAIDARYHGARSGGAKGSAAYVAATRAGTSGGCSTCSNRTPRSTRSGSACSASAWAASRRGWPRRWTSGWRSRPR